MAPRRLRRMLAQSIVCAVLWAGLGGGLRADVATYLGKPVGSVRLMVEGTETSDPLLRQIIATCPDCRVMMLSAHGRPEIIEATRQARASGYTTKDTPSQQIIENLRRIARGEEVFTSANY